MLLAEIGVGITGFGAFFILFGILLYFDSVLLAFGNVSPPALSTYPGWPRRVSPKFIQITAIQGGRGLMGGGTTAGSVGMDNPS